MGPKMPTSSGCRMCVEFSGRYTYSMLLLEHRLMTSMLMWDDRLSQMRTLLPWIGKKQEFFLLKKYF
jgi:hypothetical protein